MLKKIGNSHFIYLILDYKSSEEAIDFSMISWIFICYFYVSNFLTKISQVGDLAFVY